MKFTFKKLSIPDVLLIEHERAGDDRGFFSEVYREKEFRDAGIPGPFVQENMSRSAQGVLRGLHFQKPPQAIAKLVRCLRGEIFDVAVDVRDGSPTFGKWVAETLSEDIRRMVYVPEGFAHGFLVLSESADVSYKQTGYYAPALEGGLAWNDPDIGIRWPVKKPNLAPRDDAWPRLRDLKTAFRSVTSVKGS